jgi:hypothetical protein
MDHRLVKVTMVVAIPGDNNQIVGPDGAGNSHYVVSARDYYPGADTFDDFDFIILEWDETEMSLVEAPPLEAPVKKPTKKISK